MKQVNNLDTRKRDRVVAPHPFQSKYKHESAEITERCNTNSAKLIECSFKDVKKCVEDTNSQPLIR